MPNQAVPDDDIIVIVAMVVVSCTRVILEHVTNELVGDAYSAEYLLLSPIDLCMLHKMIA